MQLCVKPWHWSSFSLLRYVMTYLAFQHWGQIWSCLQHSATERCGNAGATATPPDSGRSGSNAICPRCLRTFESTGYGIWVKLCTSISKNTLIYFYSILFLRTQICTMIMSWGLMDYCGFSLHLEYPMLGICCFTRIRRRRQQTGERSAKKCFWLGIVPHSKPIYLWTWVLRWAMGLATPG